MLWRPSCENLEPMRYRRFGRAGWSVSEVGYGMWGMADWTGSDDGESEGSLQQAVERGFTFFDTAWGYGEGKSERLLGRLLRRNAGKKLYTATKIPSVGVECVRRSDLPASACYPPERIEEYVGKSLENAGVDAFDLMQLHTWEDAWLEDDRWIGKMTELKAAGMFHAIGISLKRWQSWNGIRAVESGLVDAVQVVYNIFEQAPRDELFAACRQHDVAVIARVPFDEGALTGTLTRESRWPEGDWRNIYYAPRNLEASVARVERLRPLVPHGMTLAELALRFVLSEPTVSTVIPGMRKPAHVDANHAASDAGPLETGLLDQLTVHRWDGRLEAWQ